eukprot:TRINITY_DN7434_c0_g1_i1.p1 TRINITY_DN7434_c0_g1~~TRINITY_DN7434_c0_g1_i1.p1  ORF type:complete len:378 (+),score=77.93 TRINITY_DN7434_c0_g1_i1:88-1221(+)
MQPPPPAAAAARWQHPAAAAAAAIAAAGTAALLWLPRQGAARASSWVAQPLVPKSAAPSPAPEQLTPSPGHPAPTPPAPSMPPTPSAPSGSSALPDGYTPPCTQAPSCTGACAELRDAIVARRGADWDGTIHTVGAYRHTLARCACSLGARVAVEVGTRHGETAEGLLRLCPNLTEVHAVDPFLGNYDPIDNSGAEFALIAKKAGLPNDGDSIAPLWADALRDDAMRVRGHGCRYRLHREKSPGAAALFGNRSIDFILIDGLHTAEGVRADIHGWLPKLRPGAIVVFNDYYGLEGQGLVGRIWPGVAQAAEEWVRSGAVPKLRSLDWTNRWTRLPGGPERQLDCGPFHLWPHPCTPTNNCRAAAPPGKVRGKTYRKR